jgi:O-acetylhomoserine (thiol)-lyase
VAAVAFASGQAAETLAILNIAEAGDHFVSSASLYGGTYNLFHYTFPKLGIEVSFVDDPDDADEWRSKIQPNTKLLFAETLGNPRGNVLDVRKVADVAHEAGVPLMVDNTVPTPYLLAADRARRRHRRALGHEVPRRPRHRDRRRRGRLRHVRLG